MTGEPGAKETRGTLSLHASAANKGSVRPIGSPVSDAPACRFHTGNERVASFHQLAPASNGR